LRRSGQAGWVRCTMRGTLSSTATQLSGFGPQR